jgi:hypothetical protein
MIRRQSSPWPAFPKGDPLMKNMSVFIALALLAAGAFHAQTASAQATPTPSMDPQAMMKAMEAAQAEASKPGDEKLSCDRLEEQMVAVGQDPALQEHVQAAGLSAQKDQAAMQGAKGQIAMQTIQTVLAATVPGAAMGSTMASAAQAPAQQAQTAARLQSRMVQAQQMMAIMPKLLRGQRLIELAMVKKCEWAGGMDSADAAKIP